MSSKVSISIGQAAKMLNVSVKTVRRWSKSGKLECFKTAGGHRRYYMEDILDLINSNISITIKSED